MTGHFEVSLWLIKLELTVEEGRNSTESIEEVGTVLLFTRERVNRRHDFSIYHSPFNITPC